MKIESFYIEGLFGCREPIKIDFKSNIHVLSGKNGAGKTTILKLMWYFISGNLEKALIEVPFKKAVLNTDIYELAVTVTDDQDLPFNTILNLKNKSLVSDEIREIDPRDISSDIRHILTKFIGSSFFFPTFRNIEGGFTTEAYNIKHEIFQTLLSHNSKKNSDSIDISHDLKILSGKLSNNDHKFYTSVSSETISNVLISKYAEIMSILQPYQMQRKDLSDLMLKHFLEDDSVDNSSDFKTIRENITNLENTIEISKQPLKRFHDSISLFLKNYRFHFGQKIRFSIKSVEEKEIKTTKRSFELLIGIGPKKPEPQMFDINILSAGEKQILTLVGYNAFFDNTIFFIDEPEISLHADWQRILFRILMKQNPTNQFIITTQSPFIYSKYPKNEVCVDPTSDRGDCEE
ncbi:AAA family ATPase [Acinetobacter ursingii]|uniref:AAA family ATPase n=1 Tax=Acinetobacter ursingii TaxID=108980 RepID=UPI003AF919DF